MLKRLWITRLTPFQLGSILKEVAKMSLQNAIYPVRKMFSNGINWLQLAKNRVKDAFLLVMDYFKGSHHDPLFYLRLMALFLFIILITGIGLFVNKEQPVLPPAEAPQTPSTNSLFVNDKEFRGKDFSSLIVMQDSSLKAVLPPVAGSSVVLGTLAASPEDTDRPSNVVLEYVVQEGDTISSISQKFNISTDTILLANELKKTSVLKVGQKLVILPTDGVLHHVKDGDTISEIAKTYQAKVEEIIAFNNLSSAGDIYIGDILIIPGGKMPVTAPTYSAPTQVPLASSYFICPLGTSCRLTQGLHWYNAVDFDGDCGVPVFAAAAGRVLKVALTNSTSRWAFGGAGNHLTILHPNGVVTFYGHLRTALVTQGQQVSQGQMIATVGGLPGTPGAGLSTGCHLHFGVTGAQNPFVR